MIATLKQGADPRIAYIEWSDRYHQDILVDLDDLDWNDNTIPDDSMVRQEYASAVSNISFSCWNESVIFDTDVTKALQFARNHFEDHETGSFPLYLFTMQNIWPCYGN